MNLEMLSNVMATQCYLSYRL